MGRLSRVCLLLCLGLLSAGAFADNLLRNGSFEATPCATPCNQDQALMPAEWVALTPGILAPDTFSNDGSYGLPPEGYGAFNGVTAQDGIRWVAGWSLYSETFGQVLTAPLVPGHRYALSGYLRQAVRTDLANPGTYEVELWSDVAGTAKSLLGSFAPTSDPAVWEKRSFTFVAPADAGAYPVIAFRSTATGRRGGSFAGADNLVLVDLSAGSGGTDSDGDGVADAQDECPASDFFPRVIVDVCETGVVNRVMPNGCTLTDQVRACRASVRNHGEFVSCVAAFTNTLQKSDLITGQEKGQIQSCAAQSRAP